MRIEEEAMEEKNRSSSPDSQEWYEQYIFDLNLV